MGVFSGPISEPAGESCKEFSFQVAIVAQITFDAPGFSLTAHPILIPVHMHILAWEM